MALNWNFNEKVGELYLHYNSPNCPQDSGDHTFNLYQGNAYLIVVHECKDEQDRDLYSVTNFFLDKEHMKNVLGLNPRKGYRVNSFFTQPGWTLKGIKLNKQKCAHLTDLVSALAKAFDDITIRITAD